jgi:hypothetical protein
VIAIRSAAFGTIDIYGRLPARYVFGARTNRTGVRLRPATGFFAALTAVGDHAGAAIWRRITGAIEQLTDTTGLLN